MVGGNGDRLLRFAARHADIVAFTGFTFPDGRRVAMTHVRPDGLLDRVRLVEKAAAEADRDPERNLLIQLASIGSPDQTAAATEFVQKAYPFDPAEIDEIPLLLIGELDQVADRVLALRERFGITYLSVLEPMATNLKPLVARLAGA
jgi:alkanesulfonate monooxygenase SsuD/methylene tetrahydromethanopterin reductase-like flavin-dependent oxidoreductase (luciferase family)